MTMNEQQNLGERVSPSPDLEEAHRFLEAFGNARNGHNYPKTKDLDDATALELRLRANGNIGIADELAAAIRPWRDGT